MATRETATKKSGKTKLTDLPARKVQQARAQQVKGGAKRTFIIC